MARPVRQHKTPLRLRLIAAYLGEVVPGDKSLGQAYREVYGRPDLTHRAATNNAEHVLRRAARRGEIAAVFAALCNGPTRTAEKLVEALSKCHVVPHWRDGQLTNAVVPDHVAQLLAMGRLVRYLGHGPLGSTSLPDGGLP